MASAWGKVRAALGGSDDSTPTPAASTSTGARAAENMRAAINNMRGNTSSAMESAGVPSQMLPAADSMCPNLTFKQRVYGCVGCVGIGILLSFMGFCLWWTGHVSAFAFVYTMGNLVSLAGTGFLFGPKRQCRQMFAKVRRVATCVYFAAMLLTGERAATRAPPL